MWKCCIMRSSAAGRAEHSASTGPSLSLPPDSRGHASRRDLASRRTLGKPAKCRFRFFPRLPAKLSVLPDKPSAVHNCKFRCRDPSVGNKHTALCGRRHFRLSMQRSSLLCFGRGCDPHGIMGKPWLLLRLIYWMRVQHRNGALSSPSWSITSGPGVQYLPP